MLDYKPSDIQHLLRSYNLPAGDFKLSTGTLTEQQFNQNIELGNDEVIVPYRLWGLVTVNVLDPLFEPTFGTGRLVLRGDNLSGIDLRPLVRYSHFHYDRDLHYLTLQADLFYPIRTWMRLDRQQWFNRETYRLDYYLIKYL